MDLTALRRWWPPVAVIGLLFAAAFAATRSAPQLGRIARGDGGADPTEGPQFLGAPDGQQVQSAAPASPRSGGGLPDWASKAALVILAVLLISTVALIVWAIVRDLLRRRNRRVRLRPAPDATSTADDLVAALDAGLLDLSDTDRDPRRAVIACWVRLEQAAAAAGTPRRPGDTPGDLVGRLLAEQDIDGSVLADLAAVYREARYATHTVDERMRTNARTALQRLRTDLAASAAAAAEVPA
jgi:hypothetical protein